MLARFVLRWQMEGTGAGVRRHRGVATPRQWADRALRRATPALFGRCSLVAPYAHPRMHPPDAVVRQAAWHQQEWPTCSAARARVRRAFWAQAALCLSARDPAISALPRTFVARLADALCYAA